MCWCILDRGRLWCLLGFACGGPPCPPNCPGCFVTPGLRRCSLNVKQTQLSAAGVVDDVARTKRSGRVPPPATAFATGPLSTITEGPEDASEVCPTRSVTNLSPPVSLMLVFAGDCRQKRPNRADCAPGLATLARVAALALAVCVRASGRDQVRVSMCH